MTEQDITIHTVKDMVEQNDEYSHLLTTDEVKLGFVSLPDDTHSLVYIDQGNSSTIHGYPEVEDAVDKLCELATEHNFTIEIKHPDAKKLNLPL